MRRWFLVSKPLRAPFRDGTTVLGRNLVSALPTSVQLAYLGDPAQPIREGDVVIPARPMGYAPGLAAKATVLLHLLHPARRRWPLHLLFTPNPTTSRVLAVLRRLSPGRPCLQTVTSGWDAARHARRLEGLDGVIVLSDSTRRALLDAGLSSERVHLIPPAVPLAESASDPAAHRRLLFAGDLDVGVTQHLMTIGQALDELPGWTLTVACRSKGPDPKRNADRLRNALANEIRAGRVELLGTVPDMDGLLRRSSLLLSLADHLRGKVDVPLVLLEGMARGLGVLALDLPSLTDVFAAAQRRDLEPGALAPAGDVAGLIRRAARAAEAPELLLRWGHDAQALVRQEFSLDGMARQHQRLYEALGR